MLAHYIHNFDPVIWHIHGPIAVRWYGLAYMVGFVGAYFLLRYLALRNLLKLTQDQVADLVMWVALLGVLAGGRLGYVLLYDLPRTVEAPWTVLEVWHGGMSSHGGMIGVVLVMVWFARKHQVSFWNIADNMACVVPVGLFCGRLANFINGELYGTPTDVPWAVIFRNDLGMLLEPRHPSQLYEAFGEGLLLFTLLMVLRFRSWSRMDGRLSGLFLAGYAVARIVAELFREPDASLILGMTRGQFYSLFALAAGAVLLWRFRHPRSENGKQPKREG